MPGKRNPAATRDRILHAAADRFLRHGAGAEGLNTVIAAAGVTKGAFFHHFAGKEPLVLAWIEEMLTPALERDWLDPLDAAEPPPALLRSLLDNHVSTTLATPPDQWAAAHCPLAAPAALGDTTAGGEPHARLVALAARWRAKLAGTLARGRTRGEVHPHVTPEDEAALIAAAVTGIATMSMVSGNPALLRAAARACGAYLDTLRPA